MKFVRIALLAASIGVLASILTDHLSTSRYPSCYLVEKGIGISTFGCSNRTLSNEVCANLTANTSVMSQCVKNNYFKYKTFPFGFKQEFGGYNNLTDYTPKIHNEILTFIITFLLVFGLASLVTSRKPIQK